jgi:ethanolamine utilization protein EutQ (cupin superfamily)
MKKNFLGLLVSALLLTACGTSSDAPEKVVEAYLAALVAGDSAQAVSLSCAAWEESAVSDSAAFDGVEVSLEGATCSVIEQDGGRAVISCKGQFVFSYAGGESQTLGLENRQYVVVMENDSWRMCGYQ